MPFAATGPQSFIEPNAPQRQRRPPRAGGASRRAPLPSSFCVRPPGGQEAQAERTPSCPWFRAPPEWAAQVSLQQVLDKTDAVVLEHHTIAFLSCIEIDIGANGKIMVTIGVAKGLLHMPHMLRVLVGFVDSQKCH